MASIAATDGGIASGEWTSRARRDAVVSGVFLTLRWACLCSLDLLSLEDCRLWVFVGIVTGSEA